MRRSIVCAALLLAAAASVAGAQSPVRAEGAARALPSSVLAAFEKAYPAATITDAGQERQDGRIAFRVEAQDRGRRRLVVYDIRGVVIEAAEEVRRADLPAAVAAAVDAHRRADLVKGMKVTRGVAVHYELTLRGSRKATMIVKPDGAVVSVK